MLFGILYKYRSYDILVIGIQYCIVERKKTYAIQTYASHANTHILCIYLFVLYTIFSLIFIKSSLSVFWKTDGGAGCFCCINTHCILFSLPLFFFHPNLFIRYICLFTAYITNSCIIITHCTLIPALSLSLSLLLALPLKTTKNYKTKVCIVVCANTRCANLCLSVGGYKSFFTGITIHEKRERRIARLAILFCSKPFVQ